MANGSGIELPKVSFTTLDPDKIEIGSYFIGFDQGNGGKLSKMDNLGNITVMESGGLSLPIPFKVNNSTTAPLIFSCLITEVGDFEDSTTVTAIDQVKAQGVIGLTSILFTQLVTSRNIGFLDNSSLISIDLSLVNGVNGVIIVDNEELTSLRLSSLSSVLDIASIKGNPNLNTLDIGQLNFIGDRLEILNTLVTAIDLPQLNYVGGSFVISDNSLAVSIDLTNLSKVIGSSIFSDNILLVDLSLASLISSGELTVTGNSDLASIDLSNLASLDLLLIGDNPLLSEVELPSLVGGNATLSNNDQLATIYMPSFARGYIGFENNLQLVSFDLSALVGADGIYISQNPQLLEVDLPILGLVSGGISISTNSVLDIINLPNVTETRSLGVASNSSLTSIDVDSLVNCTGVLGIYENPALTSFLITSLEETDGFTFTNNDSILALNAPTLVTAGGSSESARGLEVSQNDSLLTCDFSSLESTSSQRFSANGGSLDISFNNSLTSIDLSSFQTANGQGISIEDNAQLTDITFNPSGFAASIYRFRNNSLSQATVDSLLVSLVAFGGPASQVNISGGTNSAPGPAGLAAKATLTAAGWSVITN
jgi:hypothetical protein